MLFIVSETFCGARYILFRGHTLVSKNLCISHLFSARTSLSAGTCLQMHFSIIFDRKELVFQLKDVNSYCLVICCYPGVSGLSTCSLNLIWAQ